MAEPRIIGGIPAVFSRIRFQSGSVLELYSDTRSDDPRARDLLKLAEAKGVRIVPTDAKRLDDLTGNTGHQGIAAKVSEGQLGDMLNLLTEPALLLVLDGVQDAHILGECLRCAEAFGAHAVIAQQDRAIELDATAEHDSYGAAETVPYITVANLVQTLRELKKLDIWVVGVVGKTENDLHNFYHSGALALVMSAEGTGLRDETKDACDQLVSIPMRGSKRKFNVSIGVGICLYEARSQRVSGEDHTQGFSVTG